MPAPAPPAQLPPGAAPVVQAPPRVSPPSAPSAPSTSAPKPPTRPPGAGPRHPSYHNAAPSTGKKVLRATSVVTLTMLLVTPAVLAAALLRPRSRTRRG
ncbi:hypothetical protein [Streptomyces sp. NPDC051173]|uniref:hypothetical protein n=1 Tax=Streptomyces sp. NPDC051173 TaxID=3155164 RepID=UPI00344BB81D